MYASNHIKGYSMTPNKTNIKEFFAGDRQYNIPLYQRAYSWEERQLSQFLDDLKEATKGNNSYFFGNVLIEKLDGSEHIDIIDGQQRISTIIIFSRAVRNVLESANEKLDSNIENSEFLNHLSEDFLIYRGKEKLMAVDYDRDYFKDFIILNDTKKHDPQTPSQKRIKFAKEYFEKELKRLETKYILKIFERMKKAEILSIPFNNKKDSVLMFELQNNRGKNLTNMEKLKSYLAYQIYTYSPSAQIAESKLVEITKIFEEIYRIINDIKTDNEDSVLAYFNISRSRFAFNYREDDNDKNYKKELKDADDKIKWIESYVKDLKNAFVNFKDFEKLDSTFVSFIKQLKMWETYPFILKSYVLFGSDREKIEQVCKLLEIIVFRHKLLKTRADISSRFQSILKNFKDIESLKEGIKNMLHNNFWYWRDEAVINSLNDIFKENHNIIPYIFMRYENYLRMQKAQTRGYDFSLKEIKDVQIEHIAPQTPQEGEELASGYCTYDKAFYDECYLHCIGNLVLISGAHNSSIGNRPFSEKLASFNASPLLQQQEIKDFASNSNGKEVWDKDSIDNRHEKLEKFILETWSFKD